MTDHTSAPGEGHPWCETCKSYHSPKLKCGSAPSEPHEHDWVPRREGDLQYCRLCPAMRAAPSEGEKPR